MHQQALLLVGAQIADGTGTPLRPADVLVEDGHIAALAPPGALHRNAPTRDLTGQVLAPGFIDVHSHADNAPLLPDDDTTKILQGVTTEIVGNCGFSLAPCGHRHAHTLAAFTQRIFPPITFDWHSHAELIATLDAAGYVTNHCHLVGHGTLRIAAMGMTNAAADTTALRHMRRDLEHAMEHGAFGLSTGLIYPPAVHADTSELLALADVLGGNGRYATHLRDEGAGLLDAIDEALRIGKVAGHTHLSHLKSAGEANWGRMPTALRRIRAARDTAAVTHDVYPYTASSTMLTAALPATALAGDDETVLARLTDTASRAEIVHAVRDEPTSGFHPDRILIASTHSHRHEGRTLTEIAEQHDTTPADALVDVLVTERLRATMVSFSMHSDDLLAALRDEHTMIGSDGLPPGTGGKPHPRLFGTFPRVLAHYTRGGVHDGHGALELPEAIRRMTALPADTFAIPDRGRITPGAIADLVAFDPATVTDVGDYRDPVHPPQGITWVCQGGHTVVDNGRYLGGRHGTRLSPAD